jgi:hypothetical protein
MAATGALSATGTTDAGFDLFAEVIVLASDFGSTGTDLLGWAFLLELGSAPPGCNGFLLRSNSSLKERWT